MPQFMKDTFLINGLAGERRLRGTIRVNGMKNAILPLFASSILFDGPVYFDNVPSIEDVHRMSELLTALGGGIENRGHGLVAVNGQTVSRTDVDSDIAKRMRASMIVNGPLLARFGAVSFPHPGGCVLGDRPIDIMMKAFSEMGALIAVQNDRYALSMPRKKLSAIDFFFRIPSVTTTETLMMAAVLAEGTTTLRNAAMEPEVVSLAEFLVSGGARIHGAGTPTITIHGGKPLAPAAAPWRTIPDRIEAGSFLILGALAATELTVTDCEPAHLGAVIEALREAGARVEVMPSAVKVSSNEIAGAQKPVTIKTHEYPGFPTDLQAPMAVLLTQADGESRIHETIFDGRLNYIADVVRMGAEITLWDAHRALVKGPTPLKGRELDGPDIRAGLAYVIAAIIAKGESAIHNVYYIDRGYERIEERLRPLGVDIRRVTAS